MLKLIPKIIATLVALVLLLLGVLAVALPRLVNSEEFRAALHESAAEALGSPVEWTGVEAGLLPLRLIVSEPVLLGASVAPEDARVAAKSIDLRISALALMNRRIQVDSLVLNGLELVVTRTADGLVLPLASEDSEDSKAEPEPAVEPLGEPAGETSPGESSEDELELSLHRISVTEGRLIIQDRTLPRPLEWRFEDVQLEALGTSLDEPLEIDFSSRLAQGERDIGGLTTSGQVSFAGDYDLEIGLDGLLLAELQPYVADATLSGALSGEIMLEGANDVVAQIETDLRVQGIDVKTFGLDLVGDLDLVARRTLDGPVDFEAGVDLGDGGQAAIDGTMTLEGAVEAKMVLTSLELEPFAQLAGEGMAISGRASGGVDLAATTEGGLSRLATDLKIASARYADAAVDVTGAVDLVLGLEGLGETDPIRFDVAMDLEGGGQVEARGSTTLAGAIDAKLALREIDLARVAAWVPEGTRVEGTLTGDADVAVTTERRVERLASKLRIESARIVSDPVDVSGAFDLDVGLSGEGPIRLDANLVLDDGSQLRVEGTSTVEGVVDVEARLETFDLAIAKPFLPDPEMILLGLATGTGRLVGDARAPEFLSIDVGIEKGAVKTSEYVVEGPFLATAKVKEPLSRPRGRIDLDLTAARVEYLDQFKKSPGTRAEMTTRFVPEESGEIVFESRLKLRDIDEILLQGAIGETTSIAVSTSNFNLKGWSEVFPALAPYEPDGVIAFDGIGVELIDGAPSQFGGRLALRGVGLTVPDAGRVRLRGSILGEGTRIRTKGLKALIAGATVGIKGSVEDPLGEGRFDLAIQTIGEAEVDDLLTELADSGGVVFGPLDLKGQVEGLWGAEQSMTDSLVGDLRFSIGEKGGGRLRGVSILRTILDQIPLLGGAAMLTRPFRGGKSVDDYFTERFDVIEGDFVIASGQVDAKLLRLAYPGYEARLNGPLQLKDLGIDMTGEVLLKGDLVSALGGLAGADVADREPIRIQLARVTNTLDDPKVEMTKETLAAVPKLLFQATGLDTITMGIGKGVGRLLDRATSGGK